MRQSRGVRARERISALEGEAYDRVVVRRRTYGCRSPSITSGLSRPINPAERTRDFSTM